MHLAIYHYGAFGGEVPATLILGAYEVGDSFDNLLKEISENTTSEEKNIIVLETLALIKSDGVYDEKEKAFMKKLIDGLGVSDSGLVRFDELLVKYTEDI